MKYIFGPVPSRRLGRSLGVSPIPHKTCNYSCVYCQLGRTSLLTNTRTEFYPVDEILNELKSVVSGKVEFDVVTIVGEGEPTLYSDLGALIGGIKGITDKPVAVITNGALLADKSVARELLEADIVMPSLDASNEQQFKQINRPHGRIKYENMLKGLIEFSKLYKGELWLEIMLIKGMNDDLESLNAFSVILKNVTYKRVYLNSPVRPPAEKDVFESEKEQMAKAVELLGGTPINMLCSGSFHSGISDDFEALVSIIKRHPMNQFEIMGFLQSRKCAEPEKFIERLNTTEYVVAVNYKGYSTYRMRNRYGSE
ncbi:MULTISPECIES: radical SAM protein [unclassified Fusibacter]|uniref:radical SAM protein n=1 Tax=unclassified Fusibacter TaxID=2624464 RepID=UPI001A9BF4E3|nr:MULTISPECIES: radical SAM protein [unclassified Fusibacter]MCK8059710.1 radical SAM protein [Fusibacter sp. A2]